MTAVFERPALPGWVYPCTLAELREAVGGFPSEDLEGLRAVGLVPQTRNDSSAFARYLFGPPRVVHIYSLPASLSYRQPPGVNGQHLENSVAAAFGMRFEKTGSRWVCTWTAGGIRRYILSYGLAHEVGHHVAHLRHVDGFRKRVPTEQFAHDYAMRRMHACEHSP